MPKYLIKWNVGYGDNYDVVEATDDEDAHNAAYEAWREDSESQSDYGAELLTPELAEEHGFEDELDADREA